MLTLAYGEYRSLEYWAMFAQTLPHVLSVTVLVGVVYAAASLAVEFCPWRWIGVPVYIVGLGLIANQFSVMGAWGPAHVGASVGLWSVPLFGVALVGKVVWMYRRGSSTDPRLSSPVTPTGGT